MKTKVIRTGYERVELVLNRAGYPMGFVCKFRDTRSTKHPWKAHRYTGQHAGTCKVSRFLGSFYACEGGKAAAIQAVEFAE